MMSGDHSHDPYDAYYFAYCCGRPYQRDDQWLSFFDIIAQRMIQYLHPDSVLDAGCAMGFLVESFRERGVEAYGMDISEYALTQVREDVKPFCRQAPITEPLPKDYDLITCIEVFEHLSLRDGIQAISNLCGHCDNLLFSSTPIDYREPTHLNVQPPDYWAELFAAQSFYRDFEFDASFITPWAVLFQRQDPGIPRIVKNYERILWHLRKENTDLRELATEYQRKLAGDEQQHKTIHDGQVDLCDKC